jgi:hypothetical protein
MRWILLALPTLFLLGLVLAISQQDATPEKETDIKVSDERPSSSRTKSSRSNHLHVNSSGGPGKDSRTEKHEAPVATDLDPIAFLEKCLDKYDREVKGYNLIMDKQESIGGRLQKPEEIKVFFREHPFSVSMQWLKGARKAERALYVAGENDGMMLARPNGFIARKVAGDIVERDPEGSEAKQSGRYPITQFGLKNGTRRTLAGWIMARKRHALHVEYQGVHRVEELGNRECYKLHRYNYDRPESGGVTDLTLYIDKETLLQVGSILKGEGGKLIGRYLFRDIHLNPDFKNDQFTKSALIP